MFLLLSKEYYGKSSVLRKSRFCFGDQEGLGLDIVMSLNWIIPHLFFHIISVICLLFVMVTELFYHAAPLWTTHSSTYACCLYLWVHSSRVKKQKSVWLLFFCFVMIKGSFYMTPVLSQMLWPYPSLVKNVYVWNVYIHLYTIFYFTVCLRHAELFNTEIYLNQEKESSWWQKMEELKLMWTQTASLNLKPDPQPELYLFERMTGGFVPMMSLLLTWHDELRWNFSQFHGIYVTCLSGQELIEAVYNSVTTGNSVSVPTSAMGHTWHVSLPRNNVGCGAVLK